MARAAIHPGEHLAEQLKELGMSAAELGRRLKVPTVHAHRRAGAIVENGTPLPARPCGACC